MLSPVIIEWIKEQEIEKNKDHRIPLYIEVYEEELLPIPKETEETNGVIIIQL